VADEEKKEPEPGEEKLNRLKTKVSELGERLAQREKELASRDRQILKLEQAMADKEGEIASLKQSLAASQEQQKRLADSLAQAVSSYKALAISAHPRLPEELITGESIEAVTDSLARARALVSKVRQALEAEAMQARFPAGAPARSSPDLSALSPKEKIQYAIGGNK
jgi:septal ring factor EnvC (AmiA/AmiB activator)